MATGDARDRWSSFLLGGLVGGIVGVAASRLGERSRTGTTRKSGLAAFEQAPCFRELEEAVQDTAEPARES
jgi:gas vesicle protein